MQHRTRYHDLAVAGERADHVGWRSDHVLERDRDHLAHARHLVAHEDLERLDRHVAQTIMLLLAQCRREPCNLLGEIDAHALVAVARQDQIRLHRGRFICGDAGAHLVIAIAGQVIKNLGTRAGVTCDDMAVRRLRADGETFRVIVVEGRLATSYGPHHALQELHHGVGAPTQGAGAVA